MNQNNIASELGVILFCPLQISTFFFDSFVKCWIIINSSSIVTSIKLDSSYWQVHCRYSNLEKKKISLRILQDNAGIKILRQDVINHNSIRNQLVFLISVTIPYGLHSIIVFLVVYEIVSLIKSKVGLVNRKEETLTLMLRKNTCDITQTIYICNCNLNIVFFFLIK